ncbi:hypothetical protein D3C76_1857910 [compost metagenome]
MTNSFTTGEQTLEATAFTHTLSLDEASEHRRNEMQGRDAMLTNQIHQQVRVSLITLTGEQ